MKKIFLLLTLLILSVPALIAHPWKPGHFVVIDTDGGLDDFRAISMLLASSDIRVLGITVTPGVLPANEIYARVSALLDLYHHQGIPVGINDVPEIKTANFPTAKEFSWGTDIFQAQSRNHQALDVLKYLYKNSTDSIHFICLGSLNIVSSLATQIPEFTSKTAEIIWSSNNFRTEESFNYLLDKEAYKKVSKLPVSLKLIDGKSIRTSVFNDIFEKEPEKLSIGYGLEINRSLQQKHQIFYDEIIPLWLHFPQFFETNTTDKISVAAINKSVTDAEIREAYVQIISGETVNMNQVINFSWRKEDYFPDVQPIMEKIILKYGKSEWVATVMTNELHRHLGIFAIVGTKMGIRAKEYFNAGVDEMKIVSYAGTIPPFSCMNDGMQVSTGATVGHGLISVAADSAVRPVADFTYLGRTIKVSLKPEYGKKIASEVKELNSIYGLNSDIYWELIRKVAVRFWANYNRHEIFTIEEVNQVF